jgi:hypothetical protein
MHQDKNTEIAVARRRFQLSRESLEESCMPLDFQHTFEASMAICLRKNKDFNQAAIVLGRALAPQDPRFASLDRQYRSACSNPPFRGLNHGGMLFFSIFSCQKARKSLIDAVVNHEKSSRNILARS